MVKILTKTNEPTKQQLFILKKKVIMTSHSFRRKYRYNSFSNQFSYKKNIYKLRSFCFFLSVFSFLSMGKPQHNRRRGKVSFVNSCIPFPSASQTFRDQSGESTRAGDFFLQNQPLKMFYKKGIFRNFVKLRRKHLCWSFFLIKSKTPTQTFSCEIYEPFKNTYFEEHL